MRKYIHAGCIGLFIICFISTSCLSFGLFAPSALALALAPHLCCSSVLFLPGLEGSRLYTGGFLSENQLWEPNRNADVEKLYLDQNGKSLDDSIYTRDIIKSTNYPAYNIDVYKSFGASMDTLVASGTISAWRAAPYDWRLDYKDILENGIRTEAAATTSLVDMVQSLAFGSKTGRVTIVAHSNGGLLAKALIEELKQQGKAGFVDNLVLVAVPELGTPQSIPTILHGYGQNIFNGIFMDNSVARTLSENMSTAYNLLPSEKYLAESTAPVVVFDPSIDSISNLRRIYGNSISSSSTLRDFLLATADGRAKPSSSDLTIPNVLNTTLISAAQSTHQDLDNWTAPPTLAVSQIVGWGLDTVQGLQYQKKTTTVCTPVCHHQDTLDYRPIFDFHGDGVVMKQSADDLAAPTYYVNLAGVNTDEDTNRSHTDILETDTVQTLIKNIVMQQNPASPGTLPSNVLTSLTPSTTENAMQVSTHSPVSLSLYDAAGNHTGPIANPNSGSDLSVYEAKIPNSYYLPFGEGTYAGIENPATTTIVLQGTGVGTFSLEMSQVSAFSTSSALFSDIPVLPSTIATLTAAADASSTLSLDLSGDGKNVMTIEADKDFDPIQYLTSMESVIATFGLNPKVEKQLDKKIDNLVSLIKKGKINKVDKKLSSYLNSVKLTKKHRKIDADDQTIIVEMFNNLLDNIN